MNRNVNLEPKSPPISVLFTHPLSLQYLRSHKSNNEQNEQNQGNEKNQGKTKVGNTIQK